MLDEQKVRLFTIISLALEIITHILVYLNESTIRFDCTVKTSDFLPEL